MADEDEVDVLGDFNLENLFSKEDGRLTSCYDGSVLGSQGTELLQCDYGITQQWLLDTAGQPCWYSNPDDTKNISTDGQQFVFSTSDPSPASSNWIENDSWNDKEKTLLEKGLDLFGRSWVRLAQFIGTKSSQQVKSYVRSHHNHFGSSEDSCTQTPFSNESGRCNSGVFSFTELIDDMQIPASMEEVIAVVSTAQPTIPSIPRRNVTTNSVVTQGNNPTHSGEMKRKLNLSTELVRGKNRRGRPSVPSKFQCTKKPSKANRRFGRKLGSNIETCHTRKMKRKPISGGKVIDQDDPSAITSNARIGIILSSGEEVVRIQKENSHDSDGDDEIEIEESVDDVSIHCTLGDSFMGVSKHTESIKTHQDQESSNENIAMLEIHNCQSSTLEVRCPPSDIVSDVKIEPKEENNDGDSIGIISKIENTLTCTYDESIECSPLKDWNEVKEGGKGSSYLTNMSHQDILESIFNLPPPTEELILDANTITEEEKIIHAEFFEGRSAKTPKRYLKIRNHILDCWYHSRPTYVTKTSVRTGLKNCGDVNCIGRIHAYLEQIGAINFGCEQARYTRPLYLISNSGGNENFTVSSSGQGKEKLSREQQAAQHQARIDAMRPRKKKNIQDGWFQMAGEGGYTITHSEDGEAIHTTVVMPEPHKNVGKVRVAKSEPIKLIYCNKFSESKQAPYSVELHIEPLLIMDVHAHSSHSEVIGLLGGKYDLKRRVLQIWRALACRSSSSGVHCDMCPVSQTEASEHLHDEGLEVVGWYHSHPTFFPNPSLQDLDTQSNMQDWFAKTASAPFVGFILSPYCPTSKTSASEYRCLIVEPNTELTSTPYRLTVNVISTELNINTLLRRMETIFSLHEENSEAMVDFSAEYSSQPPITYKEKCVASAREHIKSSLPLPTKEVEQILVKTILQACNTLMVLKKTRNEGDADSHG
ncbi:histone H2A deubiquitinase MYSM1-like [Periplaneta americana]|uniref:histone H2A deubiquitinase MYSM1-like n=1 Tax=Periplaneta americana TaxID=6978 RepID=UPI0037E8E757